MTFWRFILASLFFQRRIHFAVALGVAAATAVLTGALLVGDSMRGSLRQLTLERLGKIDEVLVADRFFRAEIAVEIRQTKAFKEHYEQAVPAVLFPSVSLETLGGKTKKRAANVLALGADGDFWELNTDGVRPGKVPVGDEIVLNAPLAEALGVAVGDLLVLRLPAANEVPADSPLGRKEERVETASGLKVIDIIPAEGLGRFALRPSQAPPRNAYLSAERMRQVIDQPGRINALFIAGESPDRPPSAEASAALAAALTPQLEDFGIRLDHVRLEFAPKGGATPPRVIYDYFHVTTERMILAPAMQAAIEKALERMPTQPALTYLANAIAIGDTERGVPYSTVTAIDSDASGPALDAEGKPIVLAAKEIALNSWTAESLGAKLGDPIRLDYFAPETAHGQAVETSATFTLAAIVPLTEPASGFRQRGRNQLPAIYHEPPTPANDWHLTPVVQGITDRDSINDWNPPFPFDRRRLRTEDDTYWENHRTTPKAFLSYAAGKKLWGSRFGHATSIRIPVTETTPGEDELRAKLLAALRADQAQLGFAPLRVKQMGLDASQGTTPFDGLFLALSFFIIAAALMLVAVLFKLGVEQRLREIGTLLALGWTPRKVSRALWLEGVLVALLGSVIGVAVGIGYAWLMIFGLTTWWVGAITTPFLELHVGWLSLVIGLVSGVIVSSLTIAWSLRQLRKSSARELLGGQATVIAATHKTIRLWNIIAAVLLVAAFGLAALATLLGGEAQAGAFVGGGAALLGALLLFAWNWLRGAGTGSAQRLSLTRLAIAAAQRNPSRSTLTIGLMAAACFLIIALSAFRLDPSASGAGGFDYVATTSEPIFADLNSAAGRKELFRDEASKLDGVTILALRYRAGDDASCNNLYQATQPQILGAPASFIEHYDDEEVTHFTFAGSAAETEAERNNPWRVLEKRDDGASDAIPVVLDKNTAMYSLHLYRGIGEEFTVEYETGRTMRFRVAGLLANSILQGSLIIGEADFARAFPEVSGYRYFLIAAPPDKVEAVNDALADRLNEQGFDPQSTTALLTELLRVQNTYLSTFQSLGALGLLLGTFGLATVQLRSVLERRGELALLRAEGFTRGKIAQLVLTESLLLLVGGLATGAVAALMAVLPHMVFAAAALPLGSLMAMLGVVLLVGLCTSLIAVRATLRADIIAALRGE